MVQIIFIRHAEKSKDPVHLSDTGKLRALFLADYLLHPYGEFDIPTKAYVMRLHGHHKSTRCFETMEPTIVQGNIPYDMIERSHTWQFAHSLVKNSSFYDHGIVCWEHSRIVDILNIMGAEISSWGLDPEAKHSGKNCFDATWVCDIDKNKNTLRLRVYKQFDLKDGKPVYKHPRTKTLYDRTFFLKPFATKSIHSCTIS